MLKEIIFKFYNKSSKFEEIKKYSWLKMYLLYPVTIMNGNVLSILISITICLSMNIFTNFISFQDGSFLDLIIWLFRFFFAIKFNICVAKFSIICTILQDKGIENRNSGMPRIERLDNLLEEYNSNYEKIKKEVIKGIISLIVLSILIIIIPIGKFIIMNWDSVKEFVSLVYVYLMKSLVPQLCWGE